jgi:hypothetical protein
MVAQTHGGIAAPPSRWPNPLDIALRKAAAGDRLGDDDAYAQIHTAGAASTMLCEIASGSSRPRARPHAHLLSESLPSDHESLPRPVHVLHVPPRSRRCGRMDMNADEVRDWSRARQRSRLHRSAHVSRRQAGDRVFADFVACSKVRCREHGRLRADLVRGLARPRACCRTRTPDCFEPREWAAAPVNVSMG